MHKFIVHCGRTVIYYTYDPISQAARLKRLKSSWRVLFGAFLLVHINLVPVHVQGWVWFNPCSTVKSARVVALFTTKRLFSWVSQRVVFELTSCFARVVTLCADKRIFSWVCQHVYLEVLLVTWRVVTLVTYERLLMWMNQHVCLDDSIPVALWITDIHVLWKWCLLTGYISVKRLKRLLEKKWRLGAF